MIQCFEKIYSNGFVAVKKFYSSQLIREKRREEKNKKSN